MTLIDYLVPSRARRAVLDVLRSGDPLTVRQLSRVARVPYSAAHREVVRLTDTGLVRRQRKGRAWHCTWNTGHPQARTLVALLGTPREAGEAAVIANLRRWGAPLAEGARSSRRLPIEDTLAQAVPLARRRPDVARIWPLVLARHLPSINLAKLAALARGLGEQRALGFLLSLSARLMRNDLLAKTAERLRDGRFRAVENFFTLTYSPRLLDLAEGRTPALARRWLFRMNTTMESFESHFRKFRRLW